jgi:CHAT domain-containing protein
MASNIYVLTARAPGKFRGCALKEEPTFMRYVSGRRYLNFAGMCFCAMALICARAFAASAQSNELDPAISSFVTQAYDAYQKKDEQLLLSLHSESSPYFPQFRQLIRQEFARNERIKLELKRVLIVRAGVQPERARIRVVVNMSASDIETAQPVEDERFGEWDHVLYLRKEGGVWRLWKFIDTADEFAETLLAAKTDAERAKIFAERSRIVTFGLEKGMLDKGRSLLEEKGDYAQARTILEIALKFAEQLKDAGGIGGALVALGDVYSAEGDYARAADLYQRVMKMSEIMGIKWGVAAMLVKVGNIHYNQGDNRQAMEYYQRSVKLYQELGSKLEIAYALASLGNAYCSQSDYERALENYQQSLKIYEQIFDRAGTSYVLDKIGAVYAAMGGDEQAVEYYQRGLKLDEELGNRAMIAEVLNGIGSLRYRQGVYREAATLSARAAELAREVNAPETLWRALTLMGRAHRALDQQTQARQAFSEAINVIERLRGQAVGNEQDRQLFFEGKTAPFIAMVELSLAQNKTEEAFVYSERAKGRMLLDVLRSGRADITKTMTVEEKEQERRLNNAIVALNTRLKQESLKPRPDQTIVAGMEAGLKKARLEYDAYQTHIYAAHPSLKIQRGEAAPISAGEALALIPDARTVLLEYTVGQEKTYLFVLSRKEESPGGVELKVYEIPINAEQLSARVLDFRRRLADNSLDFKEPARQLYELLLKPAEKELDGSKTVCIVPADQLWELPFQALLSKPYRYFLEDHALFYAPSLSVLREMRKKKGESLLQATAAAGLSTHADASTPHGSHMRVSSNSTAATQVLLALGNPALTDKLISRSKSRDRDLAISALPEAEREVKALGEIYGSLNSRILTGAAAQEETVKAEAWKYPVLHFATHGTLDNDDPLYSRLLLSSSSENEDGFLEAREIMKLDLRAELVVLSACQTARGRVHAGEGLVGMSWALFIAGASTTVASQWKVDSASTARLMVYFHRLLQRANGGAHMDKAEALRLASLQVMSDPKYRHPFFWSGFVLVGDGR